MSPLAGRKPRISSTYNSFTHFLVIMGFHDARKWFKKKKKNPMYHSLWDPFQYKENLSRYRYYWRCFSGDLHLYIETAPDEPFIMREIKKMQVDIFFAQRNEDQKTLFNWIYPKIVSHPQSTDMWYPQFRQSSPYWNTHVVDILVIYV